MSVQDAFALYSKGEYDKIFTIYEFLRKLIGEGEVIDNLSDFPKIERRVRGE